MKTKTFDCVAMKRSGAARVRKQLDGASPEQELAFWRKQTEALYRRQAELRKAAVSREE